MGTATAEAQAEAASPLPDAQGTESAIAVAGGTGQAGSGGGGAPSLTILWVALGVAALIIAGVWFQARRRARRPSTPDGPGPDIFDDGETAPEPEAAGDTGPVDSTEVASK
jgi:hypothetical protein